MIEDKINFLLIGNIKPILMTLILNMEAKNDVIKYVIIKKHRKPHLLNQAFLKTQARSFLDL